MLECQSQGSLIKNPSLAKKLAAAVAKKGLSTKSPNPALLLAKAISQTNMATLPQ